MRDVTLTVLGLAGLSLLLCGSGELLAQTDTAAGSEGTLGTDTRVQGTTPGDVRVGTSGTASPGTQAEGTAGTGGSGTLGTGAGETGGGADASSVELRQTVLQLQSEVAQLRQDLARVRSELASVTANAGNAAAAGPGVGGSGEAGLAPSAAPSGATAGQDRAGGDTAAQGTVSDGTAAQGNAPRGSTAQPGTAAPRGAPARNPADPGQAVVDAIYTGTVRSVSAGRLVLLDDAGQPFTVELGERTRFLRNGQRISAQELKQGTRVRATVDMLSGRNQATEVTTLPAR
jgi:hypothetical protein